MFKSYRKYHSCLLSLLLTAVIIPISIQGQQTSTLFNHYNIQNGLITNNMKYIYIDTEGFVWLGTYAGLQKFDGYEFRNYNHEPGSPSSI